MYVMQTVLIVAANEHTVGFAARSDLTRCLIITSCNINIIRTKIADPDFMNDTSMIDEIPTKTFGDLVAANLTDVSSS